MQTVEHVPTQKLVGRAHTELAPNFDKSRQNREHLKIVM